MRGLKPALLAQKSHACVCVFRFRVLMEILKPDNPDATVSLKGLEYMDVPASASRDYTMSFFAYREGTYSTKVSSHKHMSEHVPQPRRHAALRPRSL